MTADKIAAEFARIAAEFNKSKGWRCYELGAELIRLSNLHYRLTGRYLNKPTRSL